MTRHCHLSHLFHWLSQCLHRQLFLNYLLETFIELVSSKHSGRVQRAYPLQRRLLCIVWSLLPLNDWYMFDIHLAGLDRWYGLVIGGEAGVWPVDALSAQLLWLAHDLPLLLLLHLLSDYFDGLKVRLRVLLSDHATARLGSLFGELVWQAIFQEHCERVFYLRWCPLFWGLSLNEMIDSFRGLLRENDLFAWTIIACLVERRC